VAGYVAHYNNERLHSAIGYVAPKDKLEGREKAIFAERDRKLAQARERRRAKRLERYGKEGSNDIFLLTEKQAMTSMTSTGETDAGSAGLRRAQSSRAQPARDTRPGYGQVAFERAVIAPRPLSLNSLLASPLMPQKTQYPHAGGYPLRRPVAATKEVRGQKLEAREKTLKRSSQNA